MATAGALLPEALVSDCLLGGLRWSATVADRAARARALGHHRHLAGKGFHHLPFFFVADLLLLLEQGHETPFASDARRGAGMAGWSDDERALRLRYENQLLGRLLMEPAVQEARELLAPHRGDAYDGRLRRLAALLLRHIAPHVPPIVRVNPAHLRGALLADEPPDAAAARLAKALGDPTVPVRQLRAIADAAGKIRWSALLLDEDLFELAHHDTLRTEAERIGCRQLIEVARRLGELDPRQVAVADEGQAETAFVDETHYPAGGLTGLTNRGSLENLVLSELVYIDRDLDVDLFDLRMMEGELLYYMRDDGVLRRKRRAVHLVIDADEALLRKPIGYDVQLSVLLAGLTLRLARDLRAVFSRDALTLHVCILCPPGSRDRWDAELALLRLLLADEAERGLATLTTAPTLSPAALHAQIRARDRKVYLVSLTARRAQAWRDAAAAGLETTPPTYGVPVHIGDPALAPEGALVLPADGAAWDRLSAIRDDIARTLAGLRR